MMMGNGAPGSRIKDFSRLGQRDRLAILAAGAGLHGREDLESLLGPPLSFDVADHMIENAIGVFGLPFGVGLNFQVNGRDRIVPMAVEEPSVVAAASSAARLARAAGGFVARAAPACMIGQIHLLGVPDLHAARARLAEAIPRLLATADASQDRKSVVEVRGGDDERCGD